MGDGRWDIGQIVRDCELRIMNCCEPFEMLSPVPYSPFTIS